PRPLPERPDALHRARAGRRGQQRSRAGHARGRARDRPHPGRADRRHPRAPRRSGRPGGHDRRARLDLRASPGRRAHGRDAAGEGSRLPVFDDVFAIIGDDQSVAENLSTFSAFVKQAREILERADQRSLVLLDELGAGTDPDEGAALAQAILEELAERGALVIATTHLEPLKAFASTHPRTRNASVEFDTATLAPTFRLRYDQPGQSYALTVAARLGLGPELIARAQAHRSEHTARLSELLATLDAHARTEAARAREIERIRAAAAAQLAKARQSAAAA